MKLEKGEITNKNLKKAIQTLLLDQFDVFQLEKEDSNSIYIDCIINILINKNKNLCPFKIYDCIGHCKHNLIGCVEGLNIDCGKEVKEIWKEFIEF